MPTPPVLVRPESSAKRPPVLRGGPGMFASAPFILFWEMTRACDLVCQHCRAHAEPTCAPDELSTAEGKALLDDAHAMGTPVVVLTGGDPAKRDDLVELVRYGNALGLRMALTPSATPLVTPKLLGQLKEAGLARIALSLDGATAPTHDAFRGVSGSFERTYEILEQARAAGLTTQINTTVTTSNRHELAQIAKDIERLELELWSVFFVVPTGRAVQELAEDRSGKRHLSTFSPKTEVAGLGPDAVEETLHMLADISENSPFDVKTTAAPHFRRVLLERKVKRDEISGITDGIKRAPRGVNDGQGIMFVSRSGEIFPSGFMPIHCGNIRTEGLQDTYRSHPTFVSLRQPDRLEGKCGVCPFRQVCGGSRARSFAVTGNPLASEPSCAYVPKETARERAETPG